MICENVDYKCRDRACDCVTCPFFKRKRITLEEVSKLTLVNVNTLLAWIHRGHSERVLEALDKALPNNLKEHFTAAFVDNNLYLIKIEKENEKQ